MANTGNRVNSNTANADDDIISYCGSMSGETFSSRRRKNTCTLRQHSIDALAQKLREHSFDYEKQQDDVCAVESGSKIQRFNNSFHYFRFIVVMLSGFALGSMILLRYNITVAILNMVNQTALYMEEHPDKTQEDFLAAGYSAGGEFEWDNEIQHMIMSWYMVAYTLPQVPCTKLGMIIGSRLAIPISLLICAASTLLTPTVAYWSWKWVIALRLVNGIGASAVLPMMLNIIEHWMPYDEISLGLTLAQMLQASLTAANPLVAGYLSSIHWKYAFYVPGGVTIVFCVIWLLLVSDRPDENWLISQKEIGVICGCTLDHDHSTHTNPHNNKSKVNGTSKKEVSGNEKQTQVPGENSQQVEEEPSSQGTWIDVFKVPSFYAYIFMWCFYCSSYSVFTFIIPTYMRQFLKIGVSQNGIYCFMIQSGCLLSVLWPHPFLRFFQTKFNMSVTASRRITHFVICFMVAATWIYVGLFHETQLILLFLNRCFHGSNDIVVTGSLMSNYAKAGLSSLVFSMVNTVGNLSVVFASTFVGYLLDVTGQSRQGWTWIYLGLGISQIIVLITFVTMVRSEPIELNKKKKKTNEKNATTTTMTTTSNLESIEVVGNKKLDGGIGNNFEKLKDFEVNLAQNEVERQI